MTLSDLLVDRRIVLAANIVDGYPSEFEYTRDFLLKLGCTDLITISHPLQKRSSPKTRIVQYQDGDIGRRLNIPRPNFPPYSHAIDLVTGLVPLKSDIWIGFNPFMTAVGGLCPRTKLLANWAIDFVPQRESNGIAERAYRNLETFMMKRIDFQIENSLAARDARVAATRKKPRHQLIAPIGVWDESFAVPEKTRFLNSRIVYFGSMDQRNGVPFLSEMLRALLVHKDIVVDLIGDGPEAHLLRKIEKEFPEQVTFHGYLESQSHVDKILREANIALAPYEENISSFTAFADPQKLKYYASNGVPTLLTDVAPAAQEMAKKGAAVLLSQTDGTAAWVDEILRIIRDEELWFQFAKNAYDYAASFERSKIYTDTFTQLLSHERLKRR